MAVNATAMRAARDRIGISRERLATMIINPFTGKPVTSTTLVRWEGGLRVANPVMYKLWLAALERARKGEKA